MSSSAPAVDGDSFGHRWLRGVIRRPTTAPAGDRARGRRSLEVVKVGGSLLARRGWPTLIACLIRGREGWPCCLVVGGGAVVDGLRAIDRVEPRSPAIMHGLSIEAMRLTARLVADAVGLPMASEPPDSGGITVLDVPAWLAAGARASAIPIGWHVTSDAIAARVAVEHGGSLVLAKSVPPPCVVVAGMLSELAGAGWVDAHFPVAAEPLETIDWAAPTDRVRA